MEKRVLMVATVAATIGSFNMDNIRILKNMGYKIDVGTDYKDTSAWPKEKLESFIQQLKKLNIKPIQISFSRNPFRIDKHISSYRTVSKLLRENDYLFVHTHTPIASAVIRIAARGLRTKIVYTAHGFHFYKGAPLKNWLIYYPIEKWLSRYTNTLITITKEDYQIAKEKFHSEKTVYVPGVGVDTEKFKPNKEGRKRIRKELRIDNSQLVLLSVGELNENKNHEAVIKAIQGMNLIYVIVGKGDLQQKLKETAKKYNVDLRLMGYRNDVSDFYAAADIYILPSIREGLNVSLMEAMASGLAVTCGNIRGNIDLIKFPLFIPTDEKEIRKAIKKAIKNKDKLGKKNLINIQNFNTRAVQVRMKSIYEGISGERKR
jgi:glycosyltransferase involved in cell wall biosynthesis